jgi:hypothetical protein
MASKIVFHAQPTLGLLLNHPPKPEYCLGRYLFLSSVLLRIIRLLDRRVSSGQSAYKILGFWRAHLRTSYYIFRRDYFFLFNASKTLII